MAAAAGTPTWCTTRSAAARQPDPPNCSPSHRGFRHPLPRTAHAAAEQPPCRQGEQVAQPCTSLRYLALRLDRSDLGNYGLGDRVTPRRAPAHPGPCRKRRSWPGPCRSGAGCRAAPVARVVTAAAAGSSSAMHPVLPLDSSACLVRSHAGFPPAPRSALAPAPRSAFGERFVAPRAAAVARGRARCGADDAAHTAVATLGNAV